MKCPGCGSYDTLPTDYFGHASSKIAGSTGPASPRQTEPMLSKANRSATASEGSTAARSDYSDWNEDADYMWYQEEGRHPEEPPDPDDFYDDRDVYDEDEDDEDMGPEHDSPHAYDRPYSAMRSKTMDTPIHREAQILRALACATPEESVRLMADLEALRSQKIADVQEANELDMDDTVIAAHLTPVVTHSYHTAATDWIDEVGAEEPEVETTALLTEATMWFRRTSSEVRSDREEFGAQAQGYAVRYASQFGVRAPEAARTFLDHVAHLHRTADDQNGEADSALPTEVPLAGHEDVLDNFQPPVDAVNAWVDEDDISSTRAPNVIAAAGDYELECYGCGKKGTTADFGMGNNRQCPSCGSYEVHSPDAQANWGGKKGNLRLASATCSVCGAAIERDPEGEENRSWHHNDGASHDHEAKPTNDHDADDKTSARATAGGLENLGDDRAKEFGKKKDDDHDEDDEKTSSRMIDEDEWLFEADVANDHNTQSGDAQSALPNVEVGDPDDKPMWPWELADGDKTGEGAADVGSVPTPGQKPEDYPQPKGAARMATMQSCPGSGAQVARDAIDDMTGIGVREGICPSCGIQLDLPASGMMPAHYFDDDPPAGHRTAGSDDYDNGDSDEGSEDDHDADDDAYWGNEAPFPAASIPTTSDTNEGWAHGPGEVSTAASRPVPLTPTQAAFRARIQEAINR